MADTQEQVTLGLSETASKVAQFMADETAAVSLTAEYRGLDGKTHQLKAVVTERKIGGSTYTDVWADWYDNYGSTYAGIQRVNYQRMPTDFNKRK